MTNQGPGTLVGWLAIGAALAIAYGAPAQSAERCELTAAELNLCAECVRLIGDFGDGAWAGWTPPPLLIAKGNADYLVGHPGPPPEAVLLPEVAIEGRAILRIEGHLVPAPAATSWQVAGVWCVAIPTLDEFQAAIDSALGKGTLLLTAEAYVRAAVHEAFHAYQMETLGGPAAFPSFDEDSSPTSAGALADAEALQPEAAALAQALAAMTRDDAVSAVSRFLNLRAARRALSPVDIAAEEAAEWTEGSARYAETKLWLVAAEAGAPLCATPQATWGIFLSQLSDLRTIPGSPTDLYYVIGAAQAFVLDGLNAAWKLSFLEEVRSLESMLAASLGAGR